jgi:hypothetical protein
MKLDILYQDLIQEIFIFMDLSTLRNTIQLSKYFNEVFNSASQLFESITLRELGLFSTEESETHFTLSIGLNGEDEKMDIKDFYKSVKNCKTVLT